MADWDYGGAYKNLDMTGDIHLPNNSVVRVHDLMNELPDFMKRADTLLIDPPWNTGNIRSFYTKADLERPDYGFIDFTENLWSAIDEISPKNLFLVMGKEYLALYLTEAQNRYKYVTFYNGTYYGKRENKCYLIHATNDFKTRRHAVLEDMDEGEWFDWIGANVDYQCIGDLCMGRGGVGKRAYKRGMPFVGTELNRKRLACLIEHISNAEAIQMKEAV